MRTCFTREIYVCYDGLPFDPQAAEKRSLCKLGVGFTGLPTTGPEAWGTATRVHVRFDRLIEAEGMPRSRDDKLNPAIFGQVKSKLGCCSGIARVASKFIAHAADARSRGQLNERERRMTLNRIEASQRVICRVAAYINGPLLDIGGESSLIQAPQDDHLEHLDKGRLAPNTVETIRRYWDKRAEKVEQWTQGDWGKLLGLPG